MYVHTYNKNFKKIQQVWVVHEPSVLKQVLWTVKGKNMKLYKKASNSKGVVENYQLFVSSKIVCSQVWSFSSLLCY